MKRLFIILFHICMWIGAVSILTIAAAGLLDIHLRWVYLVYFVLGLYISIIAFLYAYCSNNPVHPLRLFVRQIVAFLTLVLSALPVIMLFLLAIHPAGSTDSLVLDAIARIAGFLSPLSVTTFCVYVFVKSLPKIYYKNYFLLKSVKNICIIQLKSVILQPDFRLRKCECTDFIRFKKCNNT